MDYAIGYYVKQTGTVATGPAAGETFTDERTEIMHATTEEQARQWASERHATYLPAGRVELWAKQWVATSKRKGAFRHWHICTFGQ